MSRTAEHAATLIYAIRRRHQPIPEGSGGTGNTPSVSWNGPCAADLEVWPCYASQAADMLERLTKVPTATHISGRTVVADGTVGMRRGE